MSRQQTEESSFTFVPILPPSETDPLIWIKQCHEKLRLTRRLSKLMIMEWPIDQHIWKSTLRNGSLKACNCNLIILTEFTVWQLAFLLVTMYQWYWFHGQIIWLKYRLQNRDICVVKWNWICSFQAINNSLILTLGPIAIACLIRVYQPIHSYYSNKSSPRSIINHSRKNACLRLHFT